MGALLIPVRWVGDQLHSKGNTHLLAHLNKPDGYPYLQLRCSQGVSDVTAKAIEDTERHAVSVWALGHCPHKGQRTA